MHFGRLARKLIAWIACAAILAGSMAPLLTQALERSPSGSSGQGRIEVCTAMGTLMVDADGGPVHEDEVPADHAWQHCDCCASHTTALGMPPASSATVFVPSIRPGLPELFLKSPRTLFAWSTAQPRAPPFVS
jgi:hypothetical protein